MTDGIAVRGINAVPGFYVAMYKATPSGIRGIYNRLVRLWERGPYSHCELVFSNGTSGSASFMDGGVRIKKIEFDLDKWDIIPLPNHLEAGALAYFDDHIGESYDLMGNLHLVIGFFPEGRRKKFCSEAIAGALGVPDPWRFGPNSLYSLLFTLSINGAKDAPTKPASVPRNDQRVRNRRKNDRKV